MLCKVCGRGKLGQGVKLIPLLLGDLIEILCWPCRYWLHTGKIYDVR